MRKSEPARLSDVAALAGVSVATASKALNGRSRVAPETRARVLQAARRLAFQPNVLAKGLISGQTRTVGLLTSDSAGRFSLPVLLGAENALGDGQMCVLLCDARGDAIREQHYLRTLLARQIEGLIVVGERTNHRPSISRDIPVPVVYAYGESADPSDVSFVPDDEGGARLAAEHLVSLGRRRIAHVTGPLDYRAVQERISGFTAVLGEAGLDVAGGGPLRGEWSQRWGRYAAGLVLSRSRDVDAVFCGSDQIATGVMDTLHARGVRVPDDVAVVGFDNWDLFAEETDPPLTSIDMNLQRLGAAAARQLFAAIDGDRSAGPHRQPCRLVIRQSTVAGAAVPAADSGPGPRVS